MVTEGRFYIIERINPNFNEIMDCVLGTEEDQRESLDKTKMLVVLYEDSIHECLEGIDEYNLEEILVVMETDEWVIIE